MVDARTQRTVRRVALTSVTHARRAGRIALLSASMLGAVACASQQQATTGTCGLLSLTDVSVIVGSVEAPRPSASGSSCYFRAIHPAGTDVHLMVVSDDERDSFAVARSSVTDTSVVQGLGDSAFSWRRNGGDARGVEVKRGASRYSVTLEGPNSNDDQPIEVMKLLLSRIATNAASD